MSWKYNNGRGAIICDQCNTLIQEGWPTTRSRNPIWGEKHLCGKCKGDSEERVKLGQEIEELRREYRDELRHLDTGLPT